MSINNARPGFGFVPEYQVSAIPWVTSSNVNGLKRHDFKKVSMFVTVKNISGPSSLRVGFTQLGVQGTNYFPLASGESFSGDYRIKSIYLSSSSDITYSIVAGMTMIDAPMMPDLTGSINGDESFDGIG